MTVPTDDLLTLLDEAEPPYCYPHIWTERPESDTRVCELCGEERAGMDGYLDDGGAA